MILLSSTLVFAQQDEHYTQYSLNQFSINPALAGNKKCFDFRMGYRAQWIGVEDAPKSGFFSATVPVRLGRRRKSHNAPVHGVGIQARMDEVGPWNETEAHFAYSIRVRISQFSSIAYGLSLGFKQVGFDVNKANTLHPEVAIFNSQKSLVAPDARLGVWLNLRKSYIGFSIHNLFQNKLKNIGLDNRYQQHFYFTYGVKIKMDQGWTFIPSLLFIKTKNTPFDTHLTALFDYDNKISLGLGIRRTDAITAQIKVKLFDVLTIGYSFDYVISKLQSNSWQSQEVYMGYNPCDVSRKWGAKDIPVFE